MTSELSGGPLDVAARRLDRALQALEQRLEPGAHGRDPALEARLTLLADQLAASQAREKALEDTAHQASLAVNRAIAEINAALAEG